MCSCVRLSPSASVSHSLPGRVCRVLRRLARGESLLEPGTGVARGLVSEFNTAADALTAASMDVVANVRARRSLRGAVATPTAGLDGPEAATQALAGGQQQLGRGPVGDLDGGGPPRPASAPPVHAATGAGVRHAAQAGATLPAENVISARRGFVGAEVLPATHLLRTSSAPDMPGEAVISAASSSNSSQTHVTNRLITSPTIPMPYPVMQPAIGSGTLTVGSPADRHSHAADKRQQAQLPVASTSDAKAGGAVTSGCPLASESATTAPSPTASPTTHQSVLEPAARAGSAQVSPAQHQDQPVLAAHGLPPQPQLPQRTGLGRSVHGRAVGHGWGARYHAAARRLPTVASDEDEEDESVVADIARRATQQAQQAAEPERFTPSREADSQQEAGQCLQTTSPSPSVYQPHSLSPAAAMAARARAGSWGSGRGRWTRGPAAGRLGSTGLPPGAAPTQSPFLPYAHSRAGADGQGDEDGDEEEEGPSTSLGGAAAGRAGSLGSGYWYGGGGHSSAAESEADAHLLYVSCWAQPLSFNPGACLLECMLYLVR